MTEMVDTLIRTVVFLIPALGGCICGLVLVIFGMPGIGLGALLGGILGGVLAAACVRGPQ